MPLPNEFNFIGVPGAGKTTALESTIGHAINELDIPPFEIRVVTYRASVAEELKNRFECKFGISPRDASDICCTLHGLARRFCWSQFPDSAEKPEFIDGKWSHWNDFKDQYGHDMRPARIDTPETNSQLTTAYTYYRSVNRDIDAVIERELYPDPEHLIKVSEDLEEFKRKKHLIEFNDCLEYATAQKFVPDARMVLIDEAQDLNPLMTGMVENFRGNNQVEYLGLAGDPFQSLYPFYGATPEYLMSFPNSFTLSETHRLHEEHYSIAKRIIASNTNFIPPEVNTKGTGGKVYYIPTTEAALRTQQHINDNGVFHLCRTNYLCSQVEHSLADQGIMYLTKEGGTGWKKQTVDLFNGLNKVVDSKALYHNELKALQKFTKMFNPIAKPLDIQAVEADSKTKKGTKDYRKIMTDVIWNLKRQQLPALIREDNNGNLLRKQIEGLIRKGITQTSLAEAVKVKVLTIHAAKGLEADTVFLYTGLPDVVNKGLSNAKTATEEAFVWYVGVSRAIKNLYVVASTGKRYKIPEPVDGWDVE